MTLRATFRPSPPPSVCRWAKLETLLTPTAARAADSVGRRHFEPQHPYRSPFMRDRDRIVHSQAFRRLMGKTQVYVGPKIDHLRTRLTHTLEVAQIARTAARAVGLNEDLTEAIALVHDLGHPPFGHAGERALDRLLAAHGGFEHNRHTLERIETLESRTPRYAGLNLSFEVLCAVAHRCKRPQHPTVAPWRAEAPPAEGRLVDLCDSIAYDAHDLDDAIRVGLVDGAAAGELAVWKLALVELGSADAGHPLFPRMIAGRIVDLFAMDSIERLTACGGDFAELAPSPLAEPKRELETFLLERVYRHPEVISATAAGERELERLFDDFTRDPGLLPEASRARLDFEPLEVVVGHHIAGMTDRYAKTSGERLAP